MRVLWVRHAPVVMGRASRDAYLVPRLSRQHEMHVVTWNDAETSPGRPWRRLMFGKAQEGAVTTWTFPKLPRPPGWSISWRSINEPIFRAGLLTLERHIAADVVVVPPSWTSMGYPPKTRAKRIFDWLDGSDWSDPRWRPTDIAYLDWSQAIVAVSPVLARRAEAWKRPIEVIPNGLELDRLLELERQRDVLRLKLNVPDRKVISLIGLTAALDHYWVESIRQVAAADPRHLFVAVGRGGLSSVMASLASELGDGFRWVGPVSYEQSLDWFAASDVTWYPAEDNGYFHAASPHKIFEGLGAGCQVVVAPLLESLSHLKLSSLRGCEPTTQSLTRATLKALQAGRPSEAERRTALAEHDWDRLAQRYSQVLES